MNGSVQQDKTGTVKYVDVELTRRNLLSLLAKLDGQPTPSVCTIARLVEADFYLTVTAVEDSVHYSERPAGAMHPATEAAISNHYAQDEDDEPCRCGHCKRGGE